MNKNKADLNKFLGSSNKKAVEGVDLADAAVKAIHHSATNKDVADEKKKEKMVRLTVDLTEDQHLALKRYMLDNNKRFKRIGSFLEYIVLREIGIIK